MLSLSVVLAVFQKGGSRDRTKGNTGLDLLPLMKEWDKNYYSAS